MLFRREETADTTATRKEALLRDKVETFISSLSRPQGPYQLFPADAHLLPSAWSPLEPAHNPQPVAHTFTSITCTFSNSSALSRRAVWLVRREEWLPRSVYLKVKPKPAKNNQWWCPAGGSCRHLLGSCISQKGKRSMRAFIKTYPVFFNDHELKKIKPDIFRTHSQTLLPWDSTDHNDAKMQWFFGSRTSTTSLQWK